MRYVDSLLKKNCYAELHDLFVKTGNPTKEITESYGAFHHMAKYIEPKDTNFHIGDGAHCTTGALFSLMTKSWNVSIDPLVNLDHMDAWREKYDIHDFFFFKKRFQDCQYDDFLGGNKNNIILVHSHVRTKDAMEWCRGWKYCYVNPCCKPNEQVVDTDYLKRKGIKTVLYGKDHNIKSPKNDVIIYENYEEVTKWL